MEYAYEFSTRKGEAYYVYAESMTSAIDLYLKEKGLEELPRSISIIRKSA